MALNDRQIDEFVAIWRQEFGVAYSRDEARTEASRLIQFFELLVRDLPSGAIRPDDAQRRVS